MSGNAEIIREFIQAWSRLDPAELAGYFAEDGEYYNIPAEPVQGRDNIEAFIRDFAAPWTATEWEILSLNAVGDMVIAERIDRTQMGDKSVELPCCGVFEMRNDQIVKWRDYFDLGTYMQAFG